jgi:endonuclease/exonuclease/phosphatase family metal-dependent hydrolase
VSRAITIFTLNTHKGFSWFNRRFILPQLRDAIRSTGADIVCLQEVTGENVLKELKHGDHPRGSHYAFLADEQWPFYVYGKNAVYPHGHHGNAILSRFPISHSSNTDISTNSMEQRGLLYCRVTLPGAAAAIHCMSVHLNLLRGGRRKQLAMAEHFIDATVPPGAPVVLAGDFNGWENTDLLSFAARMQLTDAVQIPLRKTVRTFPAKFPLVPLDHILVRGLQVVRSVRYQGGVWDRLSDHAALGATVELA